MSTSTSRTPLPRPAEPPATRPGPGPLRTGTRLPQQRVRPRVRARARAVLLEAVVLQLLGVSGQKQAHGGSRCPARGEGWPRGRGHCVHCGRPVISDWVASGEAATAWEACSARPFRNCGSCTRALSTDGSGTGVRSRSLAAGAQVAGAGAASPMSPARGHAGSRPPRVAAVPSSLARASWCTGPCFLLLPKNGGPSSGRRPCPGSWSLERRIERDTRARR